MVDESKGRYAALEKRLQAYLEASRARLTPEEDSLARELDMKYVNIGLTTRLTERVQGFLASDRILVVVYDKERYAALHHHQLGVSAAGWAGYATDGNFDGTVIEIKCAKSAELILRILEDKDLEDLRGGVMLTLQHEVGHLKLGEYARSMGYEDTGRTEGMAQLYGLGRVENGRRDNAIDAMAQMVAMGYYLFPSGSIEEHTADTFAHWNDNDDNSMRAMLRMTDRGKGIGMNKFPYLGEETVEREVAARAHAYLGQLEKALGSADRSGDALWTHVEGGV